MVLQKEVISIETIERFLKDLKSRAESRPLEDHHKTSGSNNNGFERLIRDILYDYPLDTPRFHYQCNFGHYFPDIDIFLDGKKYGIELKSTQNDTYVINGGSVLETTGGSGYTEIFLFFGTRSSKDDNKYKIRFMPYWKAIKAVKVTHSPRYLLDMDTTESLFHSNDDYEKLRQGAKVEKIHFIHNELRKAAGNKWYSPQEVEKVPPVPFNSLDQMEKSKLICEALIIFPSDLLRKKALYDNINKYFISQYFVFSSSMRDSFSAGGKLSYGSVQFPQIISIFRKHHKEIQEILDNSTREFRHLCSQNWNIKPSVSTSLFNIYCKNLDYLGKTYLSEELKILHKTLSQIIFE